MLPGNYYFGQQRLVEVTQPSGLKCVGKFYHGPWCLGVRTNHHNTAHLQGGFDDWGG